MALLQPSASPFNATSTASLAIVGKTSLSVENPDISAAVAAANATSRTGDQISLYVVHEGDTLPAIAKLFGVTVNTIVWANDIKGNTIRPGDELVILPINGIEYTVKSGDTLQSIAKKYKGDIDEIAQFNDLSSDARLAIGQSLIIPDGEISAGSTVSGSKSQGSVTGHGTVVAGVNNGVGVSVKASGALNAPSNAPVVGERGPSSASFVGYWERPIIGGIKTQGIHGHNGVDLSAAYGTSILAAADGQVIIAKQGGWNGGYGSYIVIKHDNGTQTLYGHLSDVDVSVGQTVSQGAVIGKMGSSGDSTGIHLHFEVHVNGVKKNPTIYLQQ